MVLIGNIIWFVFGGLIMGLAWWLAGILCFISIIGIPWGKACFVIGQFTFWPFGKEAVSRKHKSGKDDIGTGTLGLIGNVFWLIFMGIWLAIGHGPSHKISQASPNLNCVFQTKLDGQSTANWTLIPEQTGH